MWVPVELQDGVLYVEWIRYRPGRGKRGLRSGQGGKERQWATRGGPGPRGGASGGDRAGQGGGPHRAAGAAAAGMGMPIIDILCTL
jgi:hypothetical protein